MHLIIIIIVNSPWLGSNTGHFDCQSDSQPIKLIVDLYTAFFCTELIEAKINSLKETAVNM